MEFSRKLLTYFGLRVPPLRTTTHLGEDFIHLLSGLRRIDEGLRYFPLREGDRIGHGVALGVNPVLCVLWSKMIGRVLISREERLFDLLWEWSCYSVEDIAIPSGRVMKIEYEIAGLSTAMFGTAVPPCELVQLTKDLFNDQALTAVGFPNGPSPHSLSPTDSRIRLIQFLRDPLCFRNGSEWVQIELATEAETLVALQNWLRQKISESGITVEVNPFSNLLIANLSDLENHPLWRLKPPRKSDDAPIVPVCIGSDDPLTFATTIRDEYQILHDALASGGLADVEARSWLNEAREAGLSTRFTVARSPNLSIRAIV